MELKSLQKTWPGWNITGELGTGAFGKVYRIEKKDVSGTYEAALKVISIPKEASEIQEIITEGMDMDSVSVYYQNMMEEIVKEFAIMEKLKGYTNIVAYEDHAVISHEQDPGWDILIRMELLTPLNTYMAKHTMTEKEVIKLGIDICKALELCQKNRIIHRDIKPENLFITQYGDFKVGDFGIARTAEKTMSAMSKKGTYTYMAPEVYRGEKYDDTVDIYSLGIVLYRMMNHYRAPFLPPVPQPITFDSREEALQRRMSGEPLPEPANGSKKLKAIIGKACAFHPADRFASAKEMREELEKLLESEKTGEQRPAQNIQEPMPGEPVPMEPVLMSDETGSEEDGTMGAFAEIPEEKPALFPKYEEEISGQNDETLGAFSTVPEEISANEPATEEAGEEKNGKLRIIVSVCLLLVAAGIIIAVFLFYQSTNRKKEEGTDPEKEVVTTEATARDPAAAYLDSYIAPEYLSDDPTQTQFELDGKLYQLPCPLDEFTDDGWEVVYKAHDTLEGGDYTNGISDGLYISKDNIIIFVEMYNFSDTRLSIEQTAVCGISIHLDLTSYDNSGYFNDVPIKTYQKNNILYGYIKFAGYFDINDFIDVSNLQVLPSEFKQYELDGNFFGAQYRIDDWSLHITYNQDEDCGVYAGMCNRYWHY